VGISIKDIFKRENRKKDIAFINFLFCGFRAGFAAFAFYFRVLLLRSSLFVLSQHILFHLPQKTGAT
jgi:hypothetical protein